MRRREMSREIAIWWWDTQAWLWCKEEKSFQSSEVFNLANQKGLTDVKPFSLKPPKL